MKYNTINEVEAKSAQVKLDYHIARGNIIEITRKSPKRSLSQNDYLHVLLGIVAIDYHDTIEHVKLEFYKKLYNKDIFEITHENKKGSRVAYRSSADLDSAEMTLSIERLRNGYSKDEGCYLPEPHEDLTIYENEIAKQRKWL